MKSTTRLMATMVLTGGLILGGLPAMAQAAPAPAPTPGFFEVLLAQEPAIDPELEPQIPVSFVAREPFVGKRRIRFLINQPRAAASELAEHIISNSNGLTTKELRRIRRSLASSIRGQRPTLRKWYRDPKVKGVFAHLVYSDHTPVKSASVTFSPIH